MLVLHVLPVPHASLCCPQGMCTGPPPCATRHQLATVSGRQGGSSTEEGCGTGAAGQQGVSTQQGGKGAGELRAGIRLSGSTSSAFRPCRLRRGQITTTGSEYTAGMGAGWSQGQDQDAGCSISGAPRPCGIMSSRRSFGRAYLQASCMPALVMASGDVIRAEVAQRTAACTALWQGFDT